MVAVEAAGKELDMTDNMSLLESLKTSGPYAIWELMEEDEKKLAAEALWNDADRDVRTALEMTLAKELKFRPHSLRKLPIGKLIGRLLLMAPKMPESMLFQFLFYLHMSERRALMIEFLDAVGLPHEEGVLDLPDDAEPPDQKKVESAGRDLLKAHNHEALVYLSTLWVADQLLWKGLEPILKEQKMPVSE